LKRAQYANLHIIPRKELFLPTVLLLMEIESFFRSEQTQYLFFTIIL
jgi:hypothetical protein